jgi:hypothetical protein
MPTRHEIVGLVLLLSSVAVAAPPRHKPVSPKVLKLRDELETLELRVAAMEREEAELGRFHSLCDADGYPLVGNIQKTTSKLRPAVGDTLRQELWPRGVIESTEACQLRVTEALPVEDLEVTRSARTP